MRIEIDDGFRLDLAEDIDFDGELEIPKIQRNKNIIIPQNLIPFSCRNRTKDFSEFIHFYEYDNVWGDVIRNPQNYVEDFKRFQGIISPDNSLYRDMPLITQLANTFRNRLLGAYFQKNGVYVIPNVRWGDSRSYTNKIYREKFAFLGVPKYNIVSIGTYGSVKGKINYKYFMEGFEAMINTLKPRIVLIYGSLPKEIMDKYNVNIQLINYPDWISQKKREHSNEHSRLC